MLTHTSLPGPVASGPQPSTSSPDLLAKLAGTGMLHRALLISPRKKAEPCEIHTFEAQRPAPSPGVLWLSLPALSSEHLSDLIKKVPQLQAKESAFQDLEDSERVEERQGLLFFKTQILQPSDRSGETFRFEPLTLVVGKDVVLSLCDSTVPELEKLNTKLLSSEDHDIVRESSGALFARILTERNAHSAALLEPFQEQLDELGLSLHARGELDRNALKLVPKWKYCMNKLEGILDTTLRVADRLESYGAEQSIFGSAEKGEAIARLRESSRELLGKAERRAGQVSDLLSTSEQLLESQARGFGRYVAIFGTAFAIASTVTGYLQIHSFAVQNPEVARYTVAGGLIAGLLFYLYAKAKKLL